MFFCDTCAQVSGWPTRDPRDPRSFGPCDVCDETARCSELQDNQLNIDTFGSWPYPLDRVFYRVFSYGVHGGGTRRHGKHVIRTVAEASCTSAVRLDGREGAYVIRHPDTKIVYHFDRMDLGGG